MTPPLGRRLAFLFGAIFIALHVPAWGQPAMEPKSVLLLAAGGMSWAWIAVRKTPTTPFPWAFVLPFGWLMLSAIWSPSPAPGLQRVIWLLSACGIGSLVSATRTKASLFDGILAGTFLHALLIFLQWIPPIRAWLPSSLGIDAYQGIGRGFFHNPNMAALPLLFCAGLVLLDRQFQSRRWLWHLIWLLPALSLTQSRWSAGAASALVAFSIVRGGPSLGWKASQYMQVVPLALLSFGLGMTAHRFGWILPAIGLSVGWFSKKDPRSHPAGSLGWATGLALCGAIIFGHLALAPKNRPSAHFLLPTSEAPNASAGEVSLSQRKSYYRAAALALLDSPLWGHGLGAARAIYPLYVDKLQPPLATAYGDFQRPNNLHSEPVEILLEGGLIVLFLLLGGLWVDHRADTKTPMIALVAPLGLLAILDFPFHYPPGLLLLGVCLARSPGEALPGRQSTFRLAALALGLGLVALSLSQARAAHAQPSLEKRFFSREMPLDTEAELSRIWKSYPFSNDLFDLLSKTRIQAASTHPCAKHGETLDELLRCDPYDHHLLLARAQLANKLGDPATASQKLALYGKVAPKDPARFLRLAEDAVRAGKIQTANLLLDEARRQPGFSPAHQAHADQLKAAIDMAPPAR